jgi:hypothetical protein
MKIYNIGVDGSTIKQWLDEKAVSSMLAKFKPSTVVMHMGQGDIVTGGGCEWIPLHFEGRSVADTNTDLSKVLTLMKAGGVTKIYYLSTVYGSNLKSWFDEFEEYDKLAKKQIEAWNAAGSENPQVVYIDAAEGLPDGSYGSDDIHLTSAAYTKWQAWLQAATADPACASWTNGVCATSGAISSAVTSEAVDQNGTAETGVATTDAAASTIAAPVGAAETSSAATDAVVSPTGGDESTTGTATSEQDDSAIYGVPATSEAATPRLI